MFAWIALAAGVAIIVPQLVFAMATSWYPGYVAKSWHAFLLYQAANALILGYNIYLLRRTLWVHDLACKPSPVSFIISVPSMFAVENYTDPGDG